MLAAFITQKAPIYLFHGKLRGIFLIKFLLKYQNDYDEILIEIMELVMENVLSFNSNNLLTSIYKLNFLSTKTVTIKCRHTHFIFC
jgi:hypothetical protein